MGYTIDELIEFAKTKPVISVNVSDLTWMYATGRINKQRVGDVVIDGFPIIVIKRPNGKLVTLDGFHRTYKAWKEGRNKIEAVMLTEADLQKLKNKVRVSNETILTSLKW